VTQRKQAACADVEEEPAENAEQDSQRERRDGHGACDRHPQQRRDRVSGKPSTGARSAASASETEDDRIRSIDEIVREHGGGDDQSRGRRHVEGQADPQAVE
jgi:hypothetical protein